MFSGIMFQICDFHWKTSGFTTMQKKQWRERPWRGVPQACTIPGWPYDHVKNMCQPYQTYRFELIHWFHTASRTLILSTNPLMISKQIHVARFAQVFQGSCGRTEDQERFHSVLASVVDPYTWPYLHVHLPLNSHTSNVLEHQQLTW